MFQEVYVSRSSGSKKESVVTPKARRHFIPVEKVAEFAKVPFLEF